MKEGARSAIGIGLLVLALSACGGADEPTAGDDGPPAEEEFTPEPIVAPSECEAPSSEIELYAYGGSWTNPKRKAYKPMELCFTVPPDQPVTVTQHNLKFKDVMAREHNFSVYRDSSALDRVFEQKPFKLGTTKTFDVPPLAAGNYLFRCDLHATTMKGVLVVE